MPVNISCREYDLNKPEWRIVRDAIAGERAIKFGDVSTTQGGIVEHNYGAYLPRPIGMETSDWDAYLSRAHWFGATGRTAKGLHGMIFSKPPVASNAPEALQAILNDIDLGGTSLNQFASDISWDLLPTNWGGILVDYPATGDGMDKATSEAAGNRAYLAYYCAESVINWGYTKRNSALMLSLVVLKEPYNASSDEFTAEIKHRYRVLSLDEAGKYLIRVFEEQSVVKQGKETDTEFVMTESYTPKMAGAPLDFIPFFPVPGSQPEKSMLIDLAYENIGHFQKTADYENGLHYTGVPTPYATKQEQPTNDQGQPDPVHLGGSQFLFFPQAETVGYLEFQGTGMEQEAKALEACEERMAILGARIISAEKKGVEAADTARIHRAGENSVLATFANNLSRVITRAVRLVARWQGIDAEDFTYELNTDYDVSLLGPQELTAITQSWQKGAMPDTVLYYNLKNGERLPPDLSLEDFLAELENARQNADDSAAQKLAAAVAGVKAKAQGGQV